ncbi:MAG: ATP-dependent metallopeptidase FtsH/Yme1/Tma family protein [Candidatus Acidiferrales bacterium]
MMVALAAVLWKMANTEKASGPNGPASSMSYSDFMTQVDKNNVASVRLLESPATAEVEGQLREPREKFRTTIPKETIPALTDQLRKQGVPVDVSEDNSVSWPRLLVNISPFLIILALWILMIRRRWRGTRSGQNPPAAPTTSIPTNRPLG